MVALDDRFGMQLEILWSLVIIAGFGFFVSLVPLPSHDFWWHLKIGEMISQTSEIPATNMFAWTVPADALFVYGAWLGEYLLFVLFRWGGLAMTQVARTIMALLAFWTMTLLARRRSGSWRIVAVVLACGTAMSMNNLAVRPQIWSWLPFAIFLYLLWGYVRKAHGWLWLLWA